MSISEFRLFANRLRIITALALDSNLNSRRNCLVSSGFFFVPRDSSLKKMSLIEVSYANCAN